MYDGEIEINKFLGGEYIQGCEEGLMSRYEPANESFYRLVHNPVTSTDYIPKSLRNFESLTDEVLNIEGSAVTKKLSLSQQCKLLNDYGLSGNVSEESLRAHMMMYIEKLDEEGRKAWLASMGDCIAKYNLIPKVGWIQIKADKKGHKNLYQFKDINLEEFRDLDFGYVPLLK